ncbi:glycosyltransferase [Patiriisocius sp. Uisw_017]|uniref:glycosyltransferase n=1 Tax=Patiriisocius sp. Uisw_017 TaxID=3230968 RepID=UPI0039E73457
MAKIKVFVGVDNIAGNSKSIAEALRTVGISATSHSFKVHPFGYGCDRDNILFRVQGKRSFFKKAIINKYSIRLIHGFQRSILLIKSIIAYDVFIFVSVNNTILNKKRDLPILKFFNKKVAFLFVGCPERNPNDKYNSEKGSYCSFCTDEKLKKYLNCDELDTKAKGIRYIEKFADYIFSQKDTLGFLKYPDKANYFYVLSDIVISENIDKFNADKVRITHFPSNSLLKGTKYVDAAIQQLDPSKIEYYSKRLSNDEVKVELRKTNILVDQFAHGYGLLAVEAMASGCVVVCKTKKWWREDYPDMPIVSCEPEELADVLKCLIGDRKRMKSLAMQGIEYYKSVHSLKVVGNYYKKIMELE